MFSLFGSALCAAVGILICYFSGYNPVLGLLLGMPLGFLTIDLFIRRQRKIYHDNIYFYLNRPDDYHGLTEALFGLLGAMTRGSVYHGYHKGRNLYKECLNLSPDGRRRADCFFRRGASGNLSVPDILSFLYMVSGFSLHIPLLTYEMCLQMLLRKGSLSADEREQLEYIADFFGLSRRRCGKLIAKRMQQVLPTLSADDARLDETYFSDPSQDNSNYSADTANQREPTFDAGQIPHNVLAAFSLLQLRYDASLNEVKSAYKKLRFSLHPDRHPKADAQEKARLNTELIKIKDAYTVICNYLTSKAS